MSQDEAPDQWEAATEHLLQLLLMMADRPGVVQPDMLSEWLATFSIERDKQGDYGASRLLLKWAEAVDEAVKDRREI